jgi:hypothetical protein
MGEAAASEASALQDAAIEKINLMPLRRGGE